MRIIVVTDQYAPMVGGVPAVTRSLATGLAQRGHSVTVLAPSTGVRSAAAMEGQTRVRYLGSLRWPWYPGMRVATIPVRAIRRHICAAAPDVVHIHSPVVLGVLANWQAARTSVPVVYTNHYLPANFAGTAGEGSPLLTSWFYSWVVSFANRCGYVTAPSTTALRLLAERGLQAPSQVISNGVDLRKFRPGPADPALAARYGLRLGRPVVLSVGRLSPEKRLDVLLAAAGRLACECQLVVVGAGPQEAALHAMVAGQGTADRVSELVSHGANGYLFGRGQSSELASYLDELNADKDARLRMGRESLRIIARHGQDSTLAQWESVYALMAGKYLRAAA